MSFFASSSSIFVPDLSSASTLSTSSSKSGARRGGMGVDGDGGGRVAVGLDRFACGRRAAPRSPTFGTSSPRFVPDILGRRARGERRSGAHRRLSPRRRECFFTGEQFGRLRISDQIGK